jgi:hypothetical protein
MRAYIEVQGARCASATAASLWPAKVPLGGAVLPGASSLQAVLSGRCAILSLRGGIIREAEENR